MSAYDTAQICLNGHVVTAYATSSPDRKQDFCSICGEKTIMSCLNCNNTIRGEANESLIPTFYKPSYCIKCGKPFPWTQASIEAAKELIELAEISLEEKESLVQDLPSLVGETPRTKVAVAKMKKFLKEAGGDVTSVMRSLLVEIVSETTAKALGLKP